MTKNVIEIKHTNTSAMNLRVVSSFLDTITYIGLGPGLQATIRSSERTLFNVTNKNRLKTGIYSSNVILSSRRFELFCNNLIS